VAARPVSGVFLKLIALLVPLVMFVLVARVMAGLWRRGLGGGTALRALAYFLLVSFVSLLIGVLAGCLLQPGSGLALPLSDIPVQGLDDWDALDDGTAFWNTLPGSLSGALRQSVVLQVLLLGMVFGASLCGLGRLGAWLEARLEQCLRGVLRLLDGVLRLAPLAAFGAMAFTVGSYGPAAALPLLKFVFCVYLACAVFVLVVLGGLLQLCGVGLWRLIGYLREELLLVASTSSSVAALPGFIARLERLGCPPEIVRLVLSAGYTFNLSGSNIYLVVAALFLAQLAHVELQVADLLMLLAVSLLTSLGSTSVAGSAFMTLTATLGVLHWVPLEATGLLLGVERLMKARSLSNVLGNCVACLVIARWRGVLDRQALRRELG